MSGMSPVVAGVLMGSVSGAAMGFMATGTPHGAAVGAVVGGVTGGLQADKAEDDRIEGLKDQKRAIGKGIGNQNALAEADYNKKAAKAQANGLDTSGAATGTNSGAVLTSVTDSGAGSNKNSLIG